MLSKNWKVLFSGPAYLLPSRLYNRFHSRDTYCEFCGGSFLHNDEIVAIQKKEGRRRLPVKFAHNDTRKCYTLLCMSEEVAARRYLNFEISENRMDEYVKEKENEILKAAEEERKQS